jgi:hypothetical protein
LQEKKSDLKIASLSEMFQWIISVVTSRYGRFNLKVTWHEIFYCPIWENSEHCKVTSFTYFRLHCSLVREFSFVHMHCKQIYVTVYIMSYFNQIFDNLCIFIQHRHLQNRICFYIVLSITHIWIFKRFNHLYIRDNLTFNDNSLCKVWRKFVCTSYKKTWISHQGST